MEQIRKQIEMIKQAIELIRDEKLKAFLQGELIGLESALKRWENENKKI